MLDVFEGTGRFVGLIKFDWEMISITWEYSTAIDCIYQSVLNQNDAIINWWAANCQSNSVSGSTIDWIIEFLASKWFVIDQRTRSNSDRIDPTCNWLELDCKRKSQLNKGFIIEFRDEADTEWIMDNVECEHPIQPNYADYAAVWATSGWL